MLSAVNFYDAETNASNFSMRKFVVERCLPLEDGGLASTYSFETDEAIAVVRIEDGFVVSSSANNSFVREMIAGYLAIHNPIS